MTKQYLIFDLDGTLIESVHDSEEIILGYLSEIPQIDMYIARTTLTNTWWTPLLQQLVIICQWLDIDTKELTQRIYGGILELDCRLFDGVSQKIQELAVNYTLFLTTGNSTPAAIKHLKKWWIYECFDIVLWSDEIPKWHDHLEIFQKSTNDDEFYKKAVYIGDGNSDRVFASEKWIDFIHIGNQQIDTYEIQSVVQIQDILSMLHN